MHLGGEHLPTFSVKASYCAGKPSNCGRQRANAKGSVRNATVPVIGFVGCWESWFCYVLVHFPLLIPGLCLAGHASQLLACWKFRAEPRSSTVRSARRRARAARLPFSAWLKRCAPLTELHRAPLHHYLTCCSGEELPAVLQLKAWPFLEVSPGNLFWYQGACWYNFLSSGLTFQSVLEGLLQWQSSGVCFLAI